MERESEVQNLHLVNTHNKWLPGVCVQQATDKKIRKLVVNTISLTPTVIKPKKNGETFRNSDHHHNRQVKTHPDGDIHPQGAPEPSAT